MIYLNTKPTSCLPSLHQVPDGHFRPHIEARLDEVPQPSIDVQAFTGSKRYLARDILSVFDGQNGRGKKWRSALPPMGVAGKDPSPEVYKDLFIHRIGIMTKANTRKGWVSLRQGLSGIKVRPLIVIQADQLKTVGNHTLIAKHFNGVTGEDCPHSIPYMPLRPVLSIVMISKAGKDLGSQG